MLKNIFEQIKSSASPLEIDGIFITVSKKNVSKDNDPNGEYDGLIAVENVFEKEGLDKPKILETDVPVKDFIDSVLDQKPAVVINLNEYLRGRNPKRVNVCAIFDLFKIAYTGNDSFAIALTLDKITSKSVMDGKGIKTPKYREFKSEDDVSADGLSFPLMVKPVNTDGSAGIDKDSIVNDEDSLKKRVGYVVEKFKDIVIVEEFIQGREISVSVIGNDQKIALDPCEIDISGTPGDLKIFGDKAKFDRTSDEYKSIKYICPAEIDESVAKKMRDDAVKAYNVFRCRDYARFDYRMKDDGDFYMLEVNANPDIDLFRIFLNKMKNGITLKMFLETMISDAIRRKNKVTDL